MKRKHWTVRKGRDSGHSEKDFVQFTPILPHTSPQNRANIPSFRTLDSTGETENVNTIQIPRNIGRCRKRFCTVYTYTALHLTCWTTICRLASFWNRESTSETEALDSPKRAGYWSCRKRFCTVYTYNAPYLAAKSSEHFFFPDSLLIRETETLNDPKRPEYW